MVNKKSMRAGYGEINVNHRGIPIPTSVGSRRYEAMFGGQSGMINQIGTNGNIPNGYAHRPELISNLFLNTPGAWWVVCERNAIFDVFEQLNTGDAIRIPRSL
jgi:hypothetical protein